MSTGRRVPLFLCCGLLSGCVHWFAILPGMSGAVGTTSHGVLLSGDHLSAAGPHFHSYKRGDRRYGIAALTGSIQRSAKKVADVYPGAELLVGDLSAASGGDISGHRSHRSGRDVDLAFYVTDRYGRPAAGHPLMRFDRFGIGLRDGEVYRFDTARNWTLVEVLLTDPDADIQWIFVSNGLKALLMEWALRNDRDVAVIARAASVLRQPGDSAPHHDHFHVRVYCPRESADFCMNTGPVWSWIDAHRSALRYTREELAELALEGLDAPQETTSETGAAP